jgi:hypothetical protein
VAVETENQRFYAAKHTRIPPETVVGNQYISAISSGPPAAKVPGARASR